MIVHKQFLGDGERTFALPLTQIKELERRTGTGIGSLFARIVNQNYAFDDLVETIHLGLIGGGNSPEDAARLVESYVVPRPIAETLPIALSILEARLFGNQPATDEGAA